MFDIGFGELLVCAIVALLVLGPERLPGAVRTVGRWVGRARHTVNNFTDQIDREIRSEELKRRIEEELKKTGMDDVTRQVKEALHAPLPPPLIGADHLRQDSDRQAAAAAENTIAPPAHADVAPALQQQPATSDAIAPAEAPASAAPATATPVAIAATNTPAPDTISTGSKPA